LGVATAVLNFGHQPFHAYKKTGGGGKKKGKGHPCTGTEALYRPYGPYGE